MSTVDWELQTTTWCWQASRKQANTEEVVGRRAGKRERLAGVRRDGGKDLDGRRVGWSLRLGEIQ